MKQRVTRKNVNKGCFGPGMYVNKAKFNVICTKFDTSYACTSTHRPDLNGFK